MPSVGETRSEVGISAAATAIKLDRLAHKRRDKNKNSAKETVRRAQILQLTPLLSQVPLGTLRQIAAKMEEVEVQDGHFLFHEGDIGDFMYVVQSGALGVYPRTPRARLRGPGRAPARTRCSRVASGAGLAGRRSRAATLATSLAGQPRQQTGREASLSATSTKKG